MGLLERRALKAFQDGTYPALAQRIETAAGHAIPVEVDWDSLQTPGQGHLYADYWPKVFFEPLIAALDAVAVDELGREALAVGLKSIRVCDSGTRRVVLDGGELLIDYPAVANIDDWEQRAKDIQDTLERGL